MYIYIYIYVHRRTVTVFLDTYAHSMYNFLVTPWTSKMFTGGRQDLQPNCMWGFDYNFTNYTFKKPT